MSSIEELLTNYYSQTIHISSNNSIMTLKNVSFDSIYKNFVFITNSLYLITRVIATTGIFIIRHGFVEIFNNIKNFKFTTENILCIMAIYVTFITIVLDNQKRKLNQQSNEIDSLKKIICHLSITDKNDELFLCEMRSISLETNKKILSMDKKIKNIEKNIKKYD